MPYDFGDFEKRVQKMEIPELLELKHKYTRACGSSSMGAAGSLALGPFMPFGLAIAAVSAGNATGKLTIVTRALRKKNANALIRPLDVVRGQFQTAALQEVGHGFEHMTGSEGVGFASEQGMDYGVDKALEARKGGRVTKADVFSSSLMAAHNCHAGGGIYRGN